MNINIYQCVCMCVCEQCGKELPMFISKVILINACAKVGVSLSLFVGAKGHIVVGKQKLNLTRYGHFVYLPM